ncbi:GAF sensor signal transduction histidine kinase [Catenulispora acidiphila DSM 44928]|uniref:GAF sensor signal transduction histidine kinase n=1 Tax=Catenulispora acidiphila (strain DSM 44928 / JCM 14897 / NBRC 102108 / NRRL B-24433 / ID139908) TaxID=479433 RepID=C7Q6M5_CATAD|nr:GAF domain-containing sensor histidine kinase [Catenulispora acidiphila]ACU74060.1 GAF sensor signal transduction histidine kinase [Catenulispora acidiphila DSM 44928]
MNERTSPQNALDTMRRLSAAVLAVSRHLATDEVLQTIVATARELIGAEYAALGIPDGAGSFAQFLVDGVSDEQWAAIGPLPRQHGMLAVMLQDPAPQRLADVREDPRFRWWPKAHPEMDAFLGQQIRDGDEILGALFLANKDGGFTKDDEELLGVLAGHAAIALRHARLYERERELAITRERNRLARELHDAVAQKLFALRLTSQAAAEVLDTDPARARAELEQVATLAKEAAEELRSVVVELRPAELEEDGLAVTLRKHVEVLDRVNQTAGGPRVTFEGEDVKALSPAAEEVLLRVAQEALHNALRHADAATISVRLREHCPAGAKSCGGALLEVVDDGAGFDPATVRRAGRSLGLVSMRDRAKSVRGRLDVASAPGAGTTIRLEVDRGRAA